MSKSLDLKLFAHIGVIFVLALGALLELAAVILLQDRVDRFYEWGGFRMIAPLLWSLVFMDAFVLVFYAVSFIWGTLNNVSKAVRTFTMWSK